MNAATKKKPSKPSPQQLTMMRPSESKDEAKSDLQQVRISLALNADEHELLRIECARRRTTLRGLLRSLLIKEGILKDK